MTFTGRLRLSLVLAAIFPTALIAIIFLVGLSQQVKRIENREAVAACGRFTELLDNTSERIRKNLQYIIDGREFQVMEWGLENRQQPDPKYQVPLLSLDFVEYIIPGGKVLISANRPALVGLEMTAPDQTPLPGPGHFVYENDLHGSHPSLALSLPTENGYVRGGIFLDGVFRNLASAVTRSDIDFIDLRDEAAETFVRPGAVGQPYRFEDRLYAVLGYDSLGEHYPLARFIPYEQRSLFADFLTAVTVVTIFSLLLVIPAGLYFSARTRREFERLSDGAVRVASGDFSHPVETLSEGEFDDLAESFNRMMRQLTDYRDRLIVSQKIAAWQTIGRKIAHEVKNPLTPISIAIDDLKDSYRSRPDDYEKILEEGAGAIKREVNRLKKLIDQFASFAKMPPPEFSTFSAAALVSDIAVLFKEEITQGRLEIQNESSDANLHLDPEQIRQVLINLIKNSLEAGGRHCLLQVTTEEGRLALTVEDDGPGLPEKIIKEGPTPYYSTKEKGSGLGLVICQRIIHDHEGAMNIENKSEGGARVVITLPMKDGQDTINR